MYSSDSMRAFPADPGVTSGDLGVCDAHPIAAAFLKLVPSLRLALSSPGTSPAARPFPIVSSGVPASSMAAAASASMMSGLGRLIFFAPVVDARSPYPTPPTGMWLPGLDRTDLSSPLAPLSDSPAGSFLLERGETRVFSVRVEAGISMLVKPLMLVTSPLSTRTRAAVMEVGAPPEMRSGTCTARPLPDLRRALFWFRELVNFAALLRLPGESEPRVSMARTSARSQNLGVTFCSSELRWDEDFFVVFLAAAAALEFGERGGLEFWSTLLRFLPRLEPVGGSWLWVPSYAMEPGSLGSPSTCLRAGQLGAVHR
mmetsp:Transcript_8994/g.36763  ORF Transcript_8994/g.36763 Transcript_8994/m.36763 type:complete len:314 (+) Transcript_8994:1314-2255(+)